MIGSGTENDLPSSLFISKGYLPGKKTLSPDNKNMNHSATLGNDKNENNYFRNCNNTYFIQGPSGVMKPGPRDSKSKEKLQSSLRPGNQSSKRKSSKQQGFSTASPFLTQGKVKNRSKSKDEILHTDGNLSNLISNCIMLPKKSRRIE